jgi:two-component system C4-dicarboxylate transport response regulator DctD
MEGAVPVVLVVDDDAAVRRFLVRALMLRGLRVRDFESGAELLAYAAECTEPVGLLVSDLRMPGFTGFEVASAARRRWPALPVLLVSGSHSETDGTITEPGPTRFMAKPFAYADLLWHVDTLLGEAGAH